MSTQPTPHNWRTRVSQYEPEAFDVVQPGLGAIALVKNEKFALLIAAAPELLEALYNALPYVDDVLADKDQLAFFKPGVVQAHAKAIREAIAKATGEQA
jgi:hypothetical protein